MRIMMGLLGLLVAAGAASATFEGGYVGAGNGADLAPLAEGCVCYGFGTVYGVWADDAGHFTVHQDQGMNAGHYTNQPDNPPPLDVNGGRWMDGWGNLQEGQAGLRTNGGFGTNAQAVGAQQFAGQDAMLRVDRQGGAHAEVHDNVGGTHATQHVGLCVNAFPDVPNGAGVSLFTHTQNFPAGTGVGNCRFET